MCPPYPSSLSASSHHSKYDCKKQEGNIVDTLGRIKKGNIDALSKLSKKCEREFSDVNKVYADEVSAATKQFHTVTRQIAASTTVATVKVRTRWGLRVGRRGGRGLGTWKWEWLRGSADKMVTPWG